MTGSVKRLKARLKPTFLPSNGWSKVGRPRKKIFKKIKKKPKKKFQGCLAQNDIRPEFHVRPKKASTCPVILTG